jgi:hypothetical protein
MLCDVCVGVIQYRRGMYQALTRLNGEDEWHYENFEDNLENLVYFGSFHHGTFDTLIDSVSRGCQICGSWWKKLSESERDSIRNFDTTVEDKALTVMYISYTWDHLYDIAIFPKGLPLGVCTHGLEPGQCLW